MKRDELLSWIKQAVREVESNADIILYGSRSRQDAGEASDWDLIILVDGDVDDSRTDRIRYQLYEIEWATGVVLSSIVRSRFHWNSRTYQSSPFCQNVRKEGIVL